MHFGGTLNPETLETQIAIIGGGGAGLAAAVAAAEKGADIILLEKARTLGGNSVRAEGLFAAESPAQRRMKIDARRDELFKVAMDYSHWKINPRIVRAFMDKSGDTIQWLEEKGVAFNVYPLYPNQVPLVWHCPKRRGVEIIEVLSKNCEDFGVRLFCETGAKEIVTPDKKGMTGVLATKKGEEIRITARSVIIATGGYAGNKGLLRKYCPYYSENLVCAGLLHRGDGLLMATKIGAATEGLGILQLSGHAIPGAPREVRVVAEEPNTIWVNKKGERFIDEAAAFIHWESVNAVVRQPDSVSYTLLDERIKQDFIESGVIKGGGLSMVPGTKLVGLGEELQLAVDEEKVKISNSWDEIARWMGATPEALRTTIDEYNSFCDQGYDEILAKDRRYLVALRTPPYYAIKCYPRFLGTIGGIKINHSMEVLDYEDNAIPGLYAAGVDTGGWESDTYCALLAGSTFGFAINSGRIAGENAVKYGLGK